MATLIRTLARLSRNNEAGQTSAEYIAVTAVAVVLVITVTWLTLSAELSNAIDLVGAELLEFTENLLP